MSDSEASLRYHVHHPSGLARGALIGLFSFFFGLSSTGASETVFDPRDYGSSTAPSPSVKWVPSEQLPEVPVPGVPAEMMEALRSPLSLAQLTDLALQLNPQTRQAWGAARAEAMGVGVVGADQLPQIGLLLNFNRLQTASQTSGNEVPAQNRYGPNLTLSWVLFDFGQRAAEVEAQRYRLLAANLAQNRALQNVAFQVEQAYYRVLGLEALVKATREQLRSFETGLDATRRRRDSGLATIGDVYRAETAAGQARLLVQRTEGELGKSRGALNSAVALPVNYPLQLRPWEDRPPVREISQSVDGLLERIKAERPDLVAAEARARAARATAKAAAAAGKPSIEVAGTAGRVEFTDSRPGVDTFNVGVFLRIPIFTGYRDTYNVARAQAVAEQAEGARDQLYKQAELDVWQFYFDLQTAATNVNSSGSLVKSATQSAASAVARYKGGVGSLLDMITAQSDETQSRVLLIQSHLDWYTALARLNFALGASDLVLKAGTVR
jgi:outer membrane protein